MKKMQILGRSLSKGEQKKIMGGVEKRDGEGQCYACYWQGMSSCWYSNSSCEDLCGRVYGHSSACVGPSECGGCVMS